MLERLESHFQNKNYKDLSSLLFEYEKQIAKNSLHLAFEQNLFLAKICCEMGLFRRSIHYNRIALLQTKSETEKAYIHLKLARVYRVLIQMKSARFELQQSFRFAKIKFPKNNFIYFVKALLWMKNHSPETDRTIHEFRVALFEESGLSGYYYRHYFTMFQCSLEVYRTAKRLGPSLQLLDWYGATSCLLAIVGLKKFSRQLLLKLDFVVNEKPHLENKAHVWKGLCADYLKDPLSAETHFVECLSTSSSTSIFDQYLVMTTLFCNLTLRGQSTKALQQYHAFQNQFPNDLRQLPIQEKSIIDFYSIGSHAMEKQFANAQEIIKRSRAIFSQSNLEKWLVTQFLGQLLTFYYFKQDYFNPEIDDTIQRFYLLQLPPRTTPIEASLFWIAKCYLHQKQYENNPNDAISRKKFLKSLQELSQNQKHPSLTAHYYFLLYLKDKHRIENLEKAKSLAQKTKNEWVLSEISKLKDLSNVK